MSPKLPLSDGKPSHAVARLEETRRWAAPQPYVETDAAFAAEPSGLRDYWRMCARRKGAVLLLSFLGAAAGVLLTLPQTPVYRARVSLEVQGVNEDFLKLRDVNPTTTSMSYSPEVDLQTQVRVLESQSLIERAVRAVEPDKWPMLKGQNGRLASWKKALGIRTAPVSMQQQLLNSVPDDLTVRSLPNTRLIEVLYDSTDPDFAAEFANVLAREYIDQNLEARWQTTQHTGDWLTRQLGELKIKLEKAQDEMQAYGRASGLLFTGEQNNLAEDKLKQLQEELSRAQADRIAKQSKYELTASVPVETLPEVLDDRVLQDYHVKLTDLRREMSELSSALTPAHPKVQKLAAQISSMQTALESARTKILSRIRNEYEAARRRENLLAADYAAQARLMSDQAGRVSHYNILKREVDTTRQLYEAMFQRVKEAGVASALRASNVRVIDRAEPPKKPHRPSLALNVMLGLLAGAASGIGLAVIRERADRSIQEPGDSALLLNVSELGVIPRAKNAGTVRELQAPRSRKRLGGSRILELEPGGNMEVSCGPVDSQPDPSPLADSFRTVLTSILFYGQNGDRPRVLVVSSANPGEGKTTIARNLGICLAEINLRVLLIDGDLRRQRLHQSFLIDGSKGLTEALRQPAGSSLADLIQRTKIPNLSLLPAGATGHTTLLYSPRLPELIEHVRKEYDMVLIDTPPVLQMPDARVFGRYADAVVLVVRAEKTTRDVALLACDRLSEDGTRVLGTILNDWDPKRARSYGYSNYYNRYHRYYHKTAAES